LIFECYPVESHEVNILTLFTLSIGTPSFGKGCIQENIHNQYAMHYLLGLRRLGFVSEMKDVVLNIASNHELL
jgi:hypothetical protein